MDTQVEQAFAKLKAYKQQQGYSNMVEVAQEMNRWFVAQGGMACMPETKGGISQLKSKDPKFRIGKSLYNCIVLFLKENYKEVSND